MTQKPELKHTAFILDFNLLLHRENILPTPGILKAFQTSTLSFLDVWKTPSALYILRRGEENPSGVLGPNY